MSFPVYNLPRAKITVTHNSTDYELQDDVETFDVILRENAGSTAQFLVEDYESRMFLDKCDIADAVKIEFKYTDEAGASYTTIFGGTITGLRPVLGDREVLQVNCHGYGVALKNMLVRNEYGNESKNPTLNKIKEVLTDSNEGIITKYVNKILGSATSSGYALTTTKIADLSSDFKYLMFPGKPALKCIEDMIDLVSAANAPSAGAHWIVDPSKNFCLATVGNHENPPADVWPTYWNTDQTGSTIEVKKDMLVTAFHKRRSLASYVLFTGKFRMPANGDFWTENNSTNWGSNTGYTPEDSGTSKVGSYSILLDKDAAGTGTGETWYPGSGSLNINVNKIGTNVTLPRISFWFYKSGTTNHRFRLYTGDVANGDYFQYDMDYLVPDGATWYRIVQNIGEYLEDRDNKWDVAGGSETWTDIDHISFRADTVSPTNFFLVDGLYIDGIITRAAYDSNSYTTECKMMHIRDDIPKDDMLTATDDSGQIAQFAKAELYRAAKQPTTAEIMIPMQEKIMAGQLAYIKFGKKSDGNFRIETDYRILEVRHHFALPHPFTYLTITDDVLNSYARGPTSQYNTLLKAATPEFQDHIRSSIIADEVDISQTILEKSYAI